MGNKCHRGVMMMIIIIMMMMMGLWFSETMENEDHKVYGLEKQWKTKTTGGGSVPSAAPNFDYRMMIVL